MELGPTGFPFERYFAEVLKQEGFSTETGQTIEGQCVTHEIDVIAKKDNKVILTECKFHADTRHKSDVKIPLYIHSRFLDLENQRKKNKNKVKKKYQGWIVTNTRFTGQALKYGACVGLYMLDWNYPENRSLKERIDKASLHPITCLTTLTKNEKRKLLQKMVVLSKDLCQDENALQSIGIKGIRRKRILAEANALCKL